MATISNTSLSISDYNASTKTVRLTFKYRLTPTLAERMAGTVYREQFSLLGRDYLVPVPAAAESVSLPAHDTAIRTFNGGMFTASRDASAIDRQFVVHVAKSILNEDPERTSSGSEVSDEVLSKVSVAAIANIPAGTALIHPGFSPLVTGTWT